MEFQAETKLCSVRRETCKHIIPILCVFCLSLSHKECEYDWHAWWGGGHLAPPQSGASWTDAQPVQQDEGRGGSLAGCEFLKFVKFYVNHSFSSLSMYLIVLDKDVIFYYFIFPDMHFVPWWNASYAPVCIRIWPDGRTGGGVFPRTLSKRRRRGRWWSSWWQETHLTLEGEEALRLTGK